MRFPASVAALAFVVLPFAAAAQLALPPVGGILNDVRRTLPTDTLEKLPVASAARELLRDRVERLRDVVRAAPDLLELDAEGQPALRGQLLLIGADDAAVAAAQRAGFTLIGRESIEGLGLSYVRLRTPDGQSLERAIRRLRKIAPEAEVSPDHIHLPSGPAPVVAAARTATLAQGAVGGRPIGLIDSGVARHPALVGPVEQRGFARGAPAASGHGTAVASLLVGSGPVKGPAAGTPLLVADVYGRDPAGGSAGAIARALGWMAQRGAPVVTISLVGPRNTLLASAVNAAQKKGMQIVAAVGNDGPAAPPAFPASYPGVLAITGVDGRNRALIEAGRSLHLDFAAPGADMLAANASGGTSKVRGTSYAAPLAAARLYRTGSVAALAREARDLGPKGPDKRYGRGLVCGDCRTPAR